MFVWEPKFQNQTIQRLSGNKIFKIGPSNICWEPKFSKSDDPTFVEEQNLQNLPIQRLSGDKTKP